MPIDPELIPAKKFTIEDLEGLLPKIKGELETIDESMDTVCRYVSSMDEIIRYFDRTGQLDTSPFKDERKTKMLTAFKLQKNKAEKEALFRFIEIHITKGGKFDLRSCMLLFPDLAKYAFLLMFGASCIIAALRLGQPANHMTQGEEDEMEDYNAPHVPESDALKSFDLDKVSRPVGINSVEELKPEPEEEKKKKKTGLMPWERQ